MSRAEGGERQRRAPGVPLIGRLDDHLRSSGLMPRGSTLTVALSGGIDSTVLLDLLRALRGRWGWTLSAAHYDHRMREESRADAEWVRARCEAIGLPCRIGRAARRPRSEAEARQLRYAFLGQAMGELGADLLATAHQADDQAETVLFRLLRGSGLAGLAGIPARRSPGIVRPLLPFWRAELEAYAGARGLEYLDDRTNRDLSITRNRIRHMVIPGIEARGATDIRRRLTRLATRAERAANVLERYTREALEELTLEASAGRIVVARSGLLAYDKYARAHLLRALAGRVGPRPGRVGTRVALEFTRTGSSGGAITLRGGTVVRREFDRLVLEAPRSSEAADDEELVLADPRSGEGEARIAGTRWHVRWACGAPLARGEGEGDQVACFDPQAIDFPLRVRAWRPGDRIVLPAGTRRLKKLFVDRRVGRSQRGGYPLLADRSGVLWIVGLTRGVRAAPADGAGVLSVHLWRER